MSTTDIVKNAARSGAIAKSEAPKSVFGYLKEHKNQIAMALPKHMNADRMARVATTCIRSTPKLLECTPESLFGAIIQCAQLGLEPGNGLGHAYLLPFDKNRKEGNNWVKESTEVQLIIGYRGMIDLARRSGQIISIEAHAVYLGDNFECALGLDSKLNHVPDWDNSNRGDPEKLTFVYAVAKLKGGGVQFQVMSKRGVDEIRLRSKSGAKMDKYGKENKTPWNTDYEAMALKSVTRRLFKWLPVSIEMQQAVGLDEKGDRGEQNLAHVISADFQEVEKKLIEAVDPDTGEIHEVSDAETAAWLEAMDAGRQ